MRRKRIFNSPYQRARVKTADHQFFPKAVARMQRAAASRLLCILRRKREGKVSDALFDDLEAHEAQLGCRQGPRPSPRSAMARASMITRVLLLKLKEAAFRTASLSSYVY